MALALLVLSAGSTSCFLKKTQPRVFMPPPLAPRPTIPKQPPEVAAAPEVTADESTASAPPELARVPVQFPRLPAPPEPRRPPVVATPKPAPTTPPPDQPPQPRLAQIFSPEQVREYNRTLDESLERVRKILGSLGGRRLSSEQADVVNRIRTFQNQAEQARDQDLVTAVSLARRADLLAQDLIGRLP